MFTFNYRINDIQEEVVISLMFKKIKVWSKTFDLSEFNEADFFDILYDDIIDEIISCDDDNQYQIYMKRENEIKKKLYDCLKKINKQINDTLHGDSKKNSSFVQSNYAYARYAIIKCFDKIKLGVKQLPKTINMIDMVEGNKCYAQIVFITTADKLDDYKTLEYEQIIGFKDITEKLFLCLGIKDIKKSNDTKNICYYYCKKNDKDTKTKIDYFSLKECEYIFSSNSSLKHELIPYLQYFYGQIDKLSLEKFSKNEINIDLYRKYYEQFIKLSKTDSVYILPFTNKLDKYKRIVLTIKDNEEKITKYFFENTDVAEIRNDEEKEYRDILLKQGVILPKNAILGSIDFVDFNKEEINKFKNGILDEDSISCSIEENFEGEKVRIQRVITSIENILSSNVKNEKLVNLVCNKDVENIQKSTYYKTNSKYISDLKSLYPLIKNNEEQLIAIDKVVQMDENEIDLMLIQGPPGTGKTELILTILKELYKRDHKVLVTSNVHVACENIFDRFKNNKDIPLKYYTSVKGDIYYDEILKNKHKYIQNQVLDGFEIYSKNEKILIDSRDKLEKINKTLAEYNSQSINMIKQKESKDKQLQKYNELLECEKRLVIYNLKIQLKKIAVSKEIVNLDSTLREYENQRIKLCRDKERLENGKKSFLSKLEVEKNKITELSDNLINLYNEKKDKECKIECNKNAISALEKNEGTLLEKNENIDRYKSFLNDLDYKIVLDAIKEWEKMGIFSNNYFKKIFGKINFEKINSIIKVKDKLRLDKSFWILNKPISFETLEFLYYQENKDSANFSSVICEECKDLVENVYSFHNCSKFKKALMSIFHFIQYNNYDKSDYNKMLKKLCRIMKNVQYNTEDYYKEILKSENLFEKIEEQIDIENKAYQANIDKIDEGIKNKNKYLQDNVKLKSEITIKNNQIVGIEKFLIDEKEKVDSIQNVINDYIPKEKALEEEIVSKEKSIEDTRKNKDILQRELIEIKEYHDNKNKIIEQIKIQISEEYNIHKEDIDGYTNFIQNYILDKKRLTKEIDLINDKYNLFINKISTLKNDGWNEDEIYTLLFNYVNELNSLIQNYKNFGDIECKGNEFDKLFSLTLNSENGSIISMTTNQSANLFGTEENRDLMFDYVIIDEASKCSFEDIVISLPKAKHLVLIGDYMQLDPKFDEYAKLNSPDNKYIDSEEKWINLKKSTFSLLFENFLQYNASNNIESFDFCPFIAIMKKQYRMNKGIFNIIAPIYSIHKGFQLVDAKEESANDFKCIQVDSEEVDLTDSTSHRNIGEADQIISFLKFFAENRQKFSHVKTIGLITPYKAQEKYLYRNLPKIDGLEIGTFDRFQGREYDMVIMSLVRTNGLGFTKDIRRMNVGFSRAKKHLLVFGNFKKLNDEAKRLKISEGDTITPQEHAENSFVKNTLIPKLYKDRQEYISIKEMIDDVSKFLRENNYD